jgi:hypothetical protein
MDVYRKTLGEFGWFELFSRQREGNGTDGTYFPQ